MVKKIALGFLALVVGLFAAAFIAQHFQARTGGTHPSLTRTGVVRP
jgi:hypothetical protein